MKKLIILYWYLYYKRLKFESREKLVKYQSKKLKKLLKYVSKHSEYYKHSVSKDEPQLETIPVIGKEEQQSNFDKINTCKIRYDEAMHVAIGCETQHDWTYKLDGYTVGLSSGTTGKRSLWVLSDREIYQWAGFVLARMLPGSILNRYKIAFFMRSDSNLYESIGKGGMQFKFISVHDDLYKVNLDLMSWKPDIVVGPPSVLSRVFELKPEKVITISEVLEKAEEETIKKNFGVERVYQVYQCTEGILGLTNKDGKFVFNEELYKIEPEYIDNDRWSPVITDLNRRTQPMIRTRMTDIVIGRHDDKSDEPRIIIDHIEGRKDDILYFNNKYGEEVSVYPDAIRKLMLIANVKWYMVVQEEFGEITIYCKPEHIKDIGFALKRMKEYIGYTDETAPVILVTKYRRYDTEVNNMKKFRRIYRQWTRG